MHVAIIVMYIVVSVIVITGSFLLVWFVKKEESSDVKLEQTLPNWIYYRSKLHEDVYFCSKSQLLIREFGILYPPVDIVGIVHDLGIEISAGGQTKVSYNPIRAVIGLDKSFLENKVEFRFELARQLGKILLPPGSDVDKFAEELIMPENMIRAIGASHRDVREFANAFGVTQQQMTRRMEDIGYRVSFCRILP
jgi:hypothetical protein